MKFIFLWLLGALSLVGASQLISDNPFAASNSWALDTGCDVDPSVQSNGSFQLPDGSHTCRIDSRELEPSFAQQSCSCPGAQEGDIFVCYGINYVHGNCTGQLVVSYVNGPPLVQGRCACDTPERNVTSTGGMISAPQRNHKLCELWHLALQEILKNSLNGFPPDTDPIPHSDELVTLVDIVAQLSRVPTRNDQILLSWYDLITPCKVDFSDVSLSIDAWFDLLKDLAQRRGLQVGDKIPSLATQSMIPLLTTFTPTCKSGTLVTTSATSSTVAGSPLSGTPSTSLFNSTVPTAASSDLTSSVVDSSLTSTPSTFTTSTSPGELSNTTTSSAMAPPSVTNTTAGLGTSTVTANSTSQSSTAAVSYTSLNTTTIPMSNSSTDASTVLSSPSTFSGLSSGMASNRTDSSASSSTLTTSSLVSSISSSLSIVNSTFTSLVSNTSSSSVSMMNSTITVGTSSMAQVSNTSTSSVASSSTSMSGMSSSSTSMSGMSSSSTSMSDTSSSAKSTSSDEVSSSSTPGVSVGTTTVSDQSDSSSTTFASSASIHSSSTTSVPTVQGLSTVSPSNTGSDSSSTTSTYSSTPIAVDTTSSDLHASWISQISSRSSASAAAAASASSVAATMTSSELVATPPPRPTTTYTIPHDFSADASFSSANAASLSAISASEASYQATATTLSPVTILHDSSADASFSSSLAAHLSAQSASELSSQATEAVSISTLWTEPNGAIVIVVFPHDCLLPPCAALPPGTLITVAATARGLSTSISVAPNGATVVVLYPLHCYFLPPCSPIASVTKLPEWGMSAKSTPSSSPSTSSAISPTPAPKSSDLGTPSITSMSTPTTDSTSSSPTDACGIIEARAPKTRMGNITSTEDCLKTHYTIATSLLFGQSTSLITTTCSARYKHACAHYASVLSVSSIKKWDKLTCGPFQGVPHVPEGNRPIVALFDRQHQSEWVSSKYYRQKTCQRDEYPPKYFLSDGHSALVNREQLVRFIPGYDNGGAGHMWGGFCWKNGLTRGPVTYSNKPTYDTTITFVGADKKTTTAFHTWVNARISWAPVFSIAEFQTGTLSAADAGLGQNPCIPSLASDKYFALLREDPAITSFPRGWLDAWSYNYALPPTSTLTATAQSY